MWTLIGCGNPNRGDDGVGVQIAQRLRHRLAQHPLPGVRVFDCGTAGMDVMFAARGSSALTIVDAAQTGDDTPPGTIYEVPGHELESIPDPGYSLHDFRWDHALYAARRLFGDEMPDEVTVFLVTAATTELGLELSPAVAKAADGLYAKLLDRMAAGVASRHQGARAEVEVKRGMLRLSADVYGRFFEGRKGVLPLPGDAGPVLVPVDEVQGGLILKLRSPRGDHAVDLSEVLLRHGWNIDRTYTCDARWDESRGGLALIPPAKRTETSP